MNREAVEAISETIGVIGRMQHNTGDEAVAWSFRGGLAAVAAMPPADRMRVSGVVQVALKTTEAIDDQRVKDFVDDETGLGRQNGFAHMKSCEVVRHSWGIKAPSSVRRSSWRFFTRLSRASEPVRGPVAAGVQPRGESGWTARGACARRAPVQVDF